MRGRFLIILLAMILPLSASAKKSEYSLLLKSHDANLQYNGALKYYEAKDYKKALALFEEAQSSFRGTETAQKITYYLADCYIHRKDYESAAHYLNSYINTYLRGDFIEECNFMLAYCYYKDSPHYELDQTSTFKAVEQLNYCLQRYPANEKAADARTMLDEMLDKLAKRELANATLYYNIGMYGGNNYRAAIVTAMNAMNDYPDSQYTEQFALIIVKAKYKETINSTEKKMYERSEDAWDECYYFLSEYPETKYRKEVEKMAAHLDRINKINLKKEKSNNQKLQTNGLQKD